MLVIAIACLYISLICLGWGEFFLMVTRPADSRQIKSSLIISCFIGLAVVGVIANLLSFIVALDNIYVQLFFLLIPALFFLTNHKWKLYIRYIKDSFSSFKLLAWVLLCSCLLAVTLLSAYFIQHPDTLIYHAQIINWIKNYRIVPGIVQLDYHLGLQSNWFVLCALFSFGFTGSLAITFINTTIVSWFMIFVIKKINHYHNDQTSNSGYYSFLFFFLIAGCLYIYPAIRLTAASASPDFIVALYVLLIGLLFLQMEQTSGTNISILFLCSFVVTIKIAALPILLVAIFLLFTKPKKSLLYFGLSAIFVMAPFIVRNIITSGHPFFPLPFAKSVSPEWQYPHHSLQEINNYILSYARTRNSEANVQSTISQPAIKWIPTWWRTLSIGDKILLCSLLISIVLFIKNLIKKTELSKRQIVCISACLIGLLLWFLKAPDPRFCMGFILLFQSIVYANEKNINPDWFSVKKVNFLCWTLSSVLLGFSFYRLDHFFDRKNMLRPSGILQQSFTTESIDGIKINYPAPHHPCGNIPVPCTYKINNNYLYRGGAIESGFKSK